MEKKYESTKEQYDKLKEQSNEKDRKLIVFNRL